MAGVGLALLTGLVSDLGVAAAADGSGTEVRMSWPVDARRPLTRWRARPPAEPARDTRLDQVALAISLATCGTAM